MRMDTIYKLPDGFRTSINVLNRVLNISCSTIEHELKKHNYKYHNRSSNCIDEKMLDIFAEKFCKNLKRYLKDRFRNMIRFLLKRVNNFTSSPRHIANTGDLRENGGISIRLQLRTSSCVKLWSLQLVKKKSKMPPF